jgi:hypothetical protein
MFHETVKVENNNGHVFPPPRYCFVLLALAC